ncbi:MAG: penicillin-binding transpeptidase domain-containing protein [Desulfurobacteriaceae bacterium]
MKRLKFLLGTLVLLSFFSFVVYKVPIKEVKQEKIGEEKPRFLWKLVNDFSYQYELFKKASVENGKYVLRTKEYTIIFTVNPELQSKVKKEFKRYKVKYGAYVAFDKDGKTICAVSSLDYPDLTSKRTFPAASTFKIITTAAALETKVADINTKLKCGGHDDSCSPSVWLSSPYRITRSLKTAFAYSSNPYFGNLGRLIGKEKLLEFAKKFGFNRQDYGFPWGIVRKPLDDYDLALMAAGLGETRISPFHEALISLIVLNDGKMSKPSLIDKIYDKDGNVVYSFKKEFLEDVISEETAEKLKKMMIATVRFGTVSDKRFFKILRRKYPSVLVGGKSGTLSELTYPEGRCEWFTGFMVYGGKEIAFSSLAVNGSKYYISGYGLGALVSMDLVKYYSAILKKKKERGG